jgi:outer membrane protein OmpA-like peptidoglycan-associated protein
MAARARSGHLIIGVGLAVMGYAVLVIAFSREGERLHQAAERERAQAPACEPAASGSATPAFAPAAAPMAALDGRGADASDPALVNVGDAAAESGSAAEGGDSATDARVFKFYSGGAVLIRDEALRLTALAKAVAKHPTAKIALEGFGDLPGGDTFTTAVAKHRLKVAQATLMRAGVTEDRVTTAIVDVATDPTLARAVRVTGTPPLSEVERP